MGESNAGLSLAAGTTLHQRYSLVSQLYASARSAVWVARDETSGGDVVLKLSADTDALRREWETLRAVNHAHVVRAFDFVESAPALFAQHRVDGASLAELGSVPASDLLRPIRLVLSALVYLHGRDVSHGDISPGNIVFDHGGAPFLVDFGSASRGSIIVGGGDGTPAYRSPERGPGDPASPADDVYALGRVLDEYAGTDSAPELRAIIDSMLLPASERPSAEQIDSALATAGISAAAMPESVYQRRPARLAMPPAAGDIEPVTARPAQPAVAPSPPPAARGAGLSPRLVVVSLVALLGVFAAALFALDRRPATTVAVMAEPEPEQTDASEEPTDDASDETAASNALPAPESSAFGERLEFTEGSLDTVIDTSRLTPKQLAGRVLGELLAKQEVLEGRGVASWAPVEYQRALETYASGDQYYLADDFANAEQQYRKTVAEFDRLIGRVTGVYEDTLTEADAAFATGDSREAERLYGIALEITPNDPRSTRGLERAKSLDEVLGLVEAAARSGIRRRLRSGESGVRQGAGHRPGVGGGQRGVGPDGGGTPEPGLSRPHDGWLPGARRRASRRGPPGVPGSARTQTGFE